MFRQRRPARFADFINWTDYRWEAGAWQGSTGARPRTRHTTPRRGYGVLQVFLAGLAVLAGMKLAASLSNPGKRSRLERTVLALLLLAAATYISKRRARRPL